MSVLVTTNAAATFCVTVTSLGTGPRIAGEVVIFVTTLTTSVWVADSFSALVALIVTVTVPWKFGTPVNRSTASCELVMTVTESMTTSVNGALISFVLFGFGPTGVDMIVASTSKPLVNCPKMGCSKFNDCGDLFVGLRIDRSTSVMKNCESLESCVPPELDA